VRAAFDAPAAAAAVPTAAGAGVTAAGVATVLAPLVIAAIAGWLIRAQITATAGARDRRINEQGAGYGTDTAANAKAMASMVTSADKLAVYERLRSQEAKAQADLYEAIGDGDEQRVQMAEQQLKFIQLQRGQVDAVFERVHAINGVEADRLRLLRETEAFLKKSESERDRRAKELPETRRAYDDTVLKTADDKEKLDILARRRAELPSNAAIATMDASIEAMPAGKERDAADQRFLEISREILEIAQQREEVEKAIADKLADQAKELAGQQKARADYVLDTQIAEARVKGLDAIANRLENEKKLREEIRRVMEQTGVTEQEAERAARRKLSAEWQLEQKKAGASSAVAPSVSAGSSSSTFRPGITGAIGAKDDRISIYDNRAVGRLREVGADGRIPLTPAPVAIGDVVPRVRPAAGASASGGAGGLAGAVKDAADAVKRDNSAANLATLNKVMREFASTVVGNNAATDKAIAGIIVTVQDLTTKVKATRTQ
jgi:hypothetical protein